MEDMEHKRPTEPTKPKKIEEDGPRKGTYDELELTSYKSEHSEWKKKVNSYDNMQVTAATQILTTYCTETMQSRLRALEDFDTKVKLDPVEMLKRIKSIVAEGSTKEHEMIQVIKRLQISLSPQMGDNETVPQYCRRVDANLRQVFESDGITWAFLYKSIRTTEAYKAAADPDDATKVTTKQKEILEAMVTKFIALVGYLGTPYGRFGRYREQVESDYAISGVDNLPDSLDKMRETLMSEAFRKPTKEWLDQKKSREQKKSSSSKPTAFNPKELIQNLPAAVYYQSKEEGQACFACGSPDSFTNAR